MADLKGKGEMSLLDFLEGVKKSNKFYCFDRLKHRYNNRVLGSLYFKTWFQWLASLKISRKIRKLGRTTWSPGLPFKLLVSVAATIVKRC